MNVIDFLYVGADVCLFDIIILEDDYEQLNHDAYPYKMAVDMLLTGSPLI